MLADGAWQMLDHLHSIHEALLLQVDEFGEACHASVGQSFRAFGVRINQYSEYASSLTLRQRCQRAAAAEVELLERCAFADTW